MYRIGRIILFTQAAAARQPMVCLKALLMRRLCWRNALNLPAGVKLTDLFYSLTTVFTEKLTEDM